MHDAGVDIREVALAQVHGGPHDLAPVVADAPASGARDLGDQALGMQSPEAAANLRTGLPWDEQTPLGSTCDDPAINQSITQGSSAPSSSAGPRSSRWSSTT